MEIRLLYFTISATFPMTGLLSIKDGRYPSMGALITWLSDPVSITMLPSVANTTELSVDTIEWRLAQQSRDTGVARLYTTSPVPTSKAYTPSVAKIYNGYCPNWPVDSALVTL